MIDQGLVDAVVRIHRLREAEEDLRSRGRILELNPVRRQAANFLFTRATRLREARMALLAEWNLV